MGIWKKSTLAITLVAMIVAATGTLVYQKVLAATGQIYLTPATSSVAHGANITLNLRINPGTTVDSVQSTINFDNTKLKYISIDSSASPFTTQLQQTISTSSIVIIRGDLSGGASSDSLVAAITFQSLVYSGSTSVTLTNANADSSGTFTNPAVTGATVTLTAGTCPSGQTGTPPSCTTPPTTGGGGSGSSGSGGATGTPPSSGPVSSSGGSSSGSTGGSSGSSSGNPKHGSPVPVKVGPPTGDGQTIGYTNLTVKCMTSAAAQVFIQYGLTQNLNLQTPLDASGTSHSVSLDPSTLAPGTTYYYRLVTKDADGTLSPGGMQTVTTKGMQVRFAVLDKYKHPLRKKTITLHSTPMTAKTDDNGYVTFSDVAAGTHELTYTVGKSAYTQEVAVPNNIQTTTTGEQTAPLQNFSVAYNLVQPEPFWHTIWFIAIVILAAMAAVFFIFRRRSVGNDGFGGGTPLDPDLVVVGGNRGGNYDTITPSGTVPSTPSPAPAEPERPPFDPQATVVAPGGQPPVFDASPAAPLPAEPIPMPQQQPAPPDTTVNKIEVH